MQLGMTIHGDDQIHPPGYMTCPAEQLQGQGGQIWMHWKSSSCDTPGHDHEGEERGGHQQAGYQECLPYADDAGD